MTLKLSFRYTTFTDENKLVGKLDTSRWIESELLPGQTSFDELYRRHILRLYFGKYKFETPWVKPSRNRVVRLPQYFRNFHIFCTRWMREQNDCSEIEAYRTVFLKNINELVWSPQIKVTFCKLIPLQSSAFISFSLPFGNGKRKSQTGLVPNSKRITVHNL